ncbi:MAG TPA: DUF4304 domain-containing protein [Mucilaginibacter sp.]|jgi:hypothetical protein
MNANGFKGIIEKTISVFRSETNSPTITNSKDYKLIIINGLSSLLQPLGYKRKGNVYTLPINDLTYYISLQSSQTSTAQRLKVTVNIEMSSARLAVFRDERMPPSAHRNYHERIGNYTEEKKDKWWVINNLQEAALASEQIYYLLANKVLPEITLFKSTDDLIAFWKKGNCKGITEFQREHYLRLLDK